MYAFPSVVRPLISRAGRGWRTAHYVLFWLGLLAGVAGGGRAARAQVPGSAAIPNTPYWTWQNPLPTGYGLTAAHVFDDSTAIVVGQHGTALKTRDRGRTWQTLNTGTTHDLTLVSFANALVGWVAVQTPPTDDYYARRPYGGIGEVRRTTDGGLSWTRQQLDNSGTVIRTLKAISPTECYVGYEELICTNPNYGCGGYGTPTLRRTTNGGQSWPLVNTAYPLFRFTTPGTGVAFRDVQSSNAVLRTRDNGQTFRDITPVQEVNRYFPNAVFADSLHGWVTSYVDAGFNFVGPNLYRTQNGGRTWTVQSARADFLNPEQFVYALAFADSLHGAAQVGIGVITTADGGRTWQDGYNAGTYSSERPLGAFAVRQLWANAGGRGFWSVGGVGRVTVSADYGQTWTSHTRNITETYNDGGSRLKAVKPLDATHAWAWGPRCLLRTADRGARWDVLPVDSISGLTGTYGEARGVDFVDRDTGCVAVQYFNYSAIRSWPGVVVVRTTDGGRHWTPRLALPYVPRQPYNLYADMGGLQAMRFGTSRRGVLVGDSGTIYTTHDGGLNWTRPVSPTRRRLTDVAWAGPGGRTVYASGDSATLCRSDDGGLNWRLVPVDSSSYMISPWQFWPAAMLPESPITGLVFTSPEVGYMKHYNGLSKTTNGGRTWVNSVHLESRGTLGSGGGQSANSTNLYFRTAREGWYFGGTTFRTADAGRTWATVPVAGGGNGALADSYNAWVVGGAGGILHYSERFLQAAPLAVTTLVPGRALALAFATTNIARGTFRVQLSNRAGRFRGGEVRVVGQGTASPISLTLPANLPAGTAYRLRVVLADSTVLGADNGQDLRVGPLPDLVVSSAQAVRGSYRNVTVTGAGTGGAGTATLAGPLLVEGTLLVRAGGTLRTGCQPITGPGSFAMEPGATLAVCDPAGISRSGATGAVQVSGTRTFADGFYTYDGTAAQVTGTGLPGQVTQLTLDNPTGLTLTQPLRVSYLLSLTRGDLTTNGQGLTMLSSAAGQAWVDNAGGAVQGTATVQRYVNTNQNPGLGYRHFSPPTANATVGGLATAGFAPVLTTAYNTAAAPGLVVPFPTVFGYDEARIASTASNFGAFDRGWYVPAGLAAPLPPGHGCTVQIAGGSTVAFTGPLNNGPLALPLARAAAPVAEGGWQLLGNPYPSPLDWSRVALPAGLEPALYTFQSTSPYGGRYVRYVNGIGNPVLDVAQGFFVRMSAPASALTLTLENAARRVDTAPQDFLRTAPDPRPRLTLRLADAAGRTDETVVYFEAGATAGFDAAFDARQLAANTGGEPSLWAVAAGGGEALGICGLPPLGGASAAPPAPLPLGAALPLAGSYTLSAPGWRNLAGTAVWLDDALTGQSLRLDSTARHAFRAVAGTLAGRFALRFGPAGTALGTGTGALAAGLRVWPNPARERLAVQVPPVPGAAAFQVELLNALGQAVARGGGPLGAGGGHLALPLAGLAPGLYVLRVRAGSGAAASVRVVVE